MDKAAGALRTIGELAAEVGRPAHILRYWETRFPQLRPLTRAGNRRYYRPDDVALVKRIDDLLARDGYTLDGAARALAEEPVPSPDPVPVAAFPPPSPSTRSAELRPIRDRLARALADG